MSRSVWRWGYGLGIISLTSAVVLSVAIWRSRGHSVELAEELEDIFSEPTFSVVMERDTYKTALGTLAKKGLMSEAVLQARFDDLSTGGILGIRSTGYLEALADFSEHRFASALKEAQALVASADPKGPATAAMARAAALAAAIETEEGKLPEAERYYRIAVSGFAAQPDRRVIVQMRLADSIERQQHRSPEAMEEWRKALDICERGKVRSHVRRRSPRDLRFAR
jgi:hypothetical protein